MEFIDLTRTMETGMPVFPGIDPPILQDSYSIADHGFNEKHLSLHSHTGTHCDAPAHILATGKTLDDIPLSHFFGRGMVIKTTDAVIGKEFLSSFESTLKKSDFLLLHTGWSSRWGHESYFSDFPVLAPEAAEWLSSFPIKGIGVDAISVDPADAGNLIIHRILLEKDIIIIENLMNLEKLPETGFTFSTFPLKIKNGDGSPVRAAAMF
ncbi:cyclase family protein [bacterium]|nr:cyclase family protein [bacterium]